MSIIVCLGNGLECACCGGSATLGGTQEAIPSARGAAFQYCSVECHDDWEQYLDDLDRRRRGCPECGYDQDEHDPRRCSRATAADRRREVAEALRLGATCV